jgi:hypothetical protein
MLSGDIPVAAYIWLKNNRIPHYQQLIWEDEDTYKTHKTVLEFENEKDAVWFAMKWT